MRDVNKSVRIAILSALGGNINVGGIVPIYDKVPDSAAAPWVKVGTQINTDNSTKDCVNTSHVATLEVITRFQEPGGGKEQIDDITDALKQLLFDGTMLTLELSDDDLIAWDGEIENDFTDEFLSGTSYVCRRIIQLTVKVQQVVVSS